MEFFNPSAFFFAVIIPLIILLYLLKRRYQEMLVSSTYLWEQVLKDMEASMPWQRLKKNLLLFLQLLAAAILILAFSRPYLPVPGDSDRHIIVVLDCSCSMMANDISPSRFAEARKEIENLIDGLGKDDEMSLIAMGEEARVLASASRDRLMLKKALQDAQLSCGVARPEPVLAIIASLAEDAGNVSVIVFSDGRTAPVEDEFLLDCPLEFRRIGRDSDNLALTALAARQEARQMILMARLHNYGNEERKTELKLQAGEALLDVREISLPPGESREIIWEDLDPGNEAFIKASLSRSDVLMLDNQAYAVLEQRDNRRILLVSQANVFLEKSLLLLPGVELYKTSTQDYEEGMDDFDLYIFDSFLPTALPRGNILLLDPPVSNSLIPVKGEFTGIKQVKPVDNQPLLNYVDLNDWQISKCRQVEVPNWCRPLLQYQEVPLLLVGEKDNRRIAIFTFDLHNSNIPLQTGFPILINNLGSWLLPASSNTLILDASQNYFSLPKMTDIDNESIIIQKEGEAEQEFQAPFPDKFPAMAPGLYMVKQADEETPFYYVLKKLNGLESDINPGELSWKQAFAQENEEKLRLSKKEIWIFLAWMAFLILVLEWEVYRRGY